MSNAETGFFRPLPLADGRLVVLDYTGEGFVPAMIEPRPIEDVSAITFLGAELAEKHPVVDDLAGAAAEPVDDEQPVTRRGPYAPLEHVALATPIPVLQGYKNTAGSATASTSRTRSSFASFGLTAAYTPVGSLPGDERGHVELDGRYLGWRGELSWNRSDFYDLFGPTKRSRKGFAAKLGYDRLADLRRAAQARRSSYDVAYYDRIDTLPGAQNVGTPFTRLLDGEVGLHYTDVRRSLGAVDDEKGIAWNAC